MDMKKKTDIQPKKKHSAEQLKPWQFKPGQSGNPAGRPPGSVTLKEFARKYLKSLTEKEKLEFMRGLDKDVIWEMAEGKPKQDLDIDATVSGPSLIRLDE